jgi:Flp pilus assembly protein TadG
MTIKFARRWRDRGASLVEFAFVMPFLLLLVLGIVEFGYVFAQLNEVRHGAHEGARLAAVDDADLTANTCDAMSLGGPMAVDFTAMGSDAGDQGSVTVTLTVNSLSGLGMVAWFLPDTVSNTADFKLEQPATNWSSASDVNPCP